MLKKMFLNYTYIYSKIRSLQTYRPCLRFNEFPELVMLITRAAPVKIRLKCSTLAILVGT